MKNKQADLAALERRLRVSGAAVLARRSELERVIVGIASAGNVRYSTNSEWGGRWITVLKNGERIGGVCLFRPPTVAEPDGYTGSIEDAREMIESIRKRFAGADIK